MSLLSFCEWLAATPASIALHESRYLYLGVLTTHVMTLFLFIGVAVAIDLRLVGFSLKTIPVTRVVSRLFPWATAGLVLMVISGVLLFYAAPIDRYGNFFFRIKVGLLVLAVLNSWIFYRVVYPTVANWDLRPVPPRQARIVGSVGLVIWAALITAGRMIPYQTYWFS
jgi:hypothetical protein